MYRFGFVVFALISSALALPAHAEDVAKKPVASQNAGGIDAKDAGSIAGIVRFKGIKPPAQPITEIGRNIFCKQCYPGEPPLVDSLVFGKNGDDDTLANVLVYVSKGLEGKTFEPAKEPVLLDQVGCMYVPHVVAVMAGQTLSVRNSDATLHNVMASPQNNSPFNFGMPAKNQVIDRVFKQPEFKINLRCFMHPWMSAYVHVLPHPFFAITGVDGSFALKGLPPGEYEISVLQETSLFEPVVAASTVKVGANQTKQCDFTYRPRTEPK